MADPRVRIVKIDSLIFDDENANRGTKKGRALLAKSLENYGAGRSVLIDKNNRILAGNQTVAAAKAAGMKEIAVIEGDGSILTAVQRGDLDIKTDRKARELAIADNRTSELGLDWNPEVLSKIDADLKLFWNEGELRKVLGDFAPQREEAPEARVDESLELQKKWKTAAGQIWSIGPHRLMCASSVDRTNITKLMKGQRAQMAFTDPPWNIAIGLDSNPRHRQREGLLNDNLSNDDYVKFIRSFADIMATTVDGDVYCVLASGEWPNIDRELRGSGFHWSATIIWVKDIFVLGRSKYHRRYEPIWYGWHEKGKSSFGEARNLNDVWEFPRPRNSEMHPTMKPVALVQNAIENSSKEGDIVYEPFAGAGSTLCAAELSKRVCFACEIDPRYVAVTLEPLSEMGLKPAWSEK